MKTRGLVPKLPVVIVFFFSIALPLADGIVHFGARASRQGERKTGPVEKKAAGSFSSFFLKLGHDFENRLFLRKPIIRIHNSLTYQCFGVSGVAKVIIGRQGWLFQARVNEDPGSAGYFPSIQPFSPEELDLWSESLKERQRWLQDRGIEYLFIPVPDKSSIYHEYLPENLREFYRQSRLDQLVEFLISNTTIPVLDVRSALLEAKKKSPVYDKTDSHWNELGACIVAGEIHNYLAKFFASAPGFALSNFRVRKGKTHPGGNLAKMLELERSLFREERLILAPNTPFRARDAKLPSVVLSSTVAAEASRNESAPFANAVLFHDSFGVRLKPFLAEFFSRIVFVRDWGFRFKPPLIEAERPFIVLDEIAEYFFYNRKPLNDLIRQNGS